MNHPPRRQKLVYLPRLKEVRAIKARVKVSNNDIAEAIGHSRWQVDALLGGNKISRSIAEKVAAYFDKPLEELFIEIDLENPDSISAA